MQNEEVQKLAEKIAQAISSESKPNDLKVLQASIEALNSRLEKIESSRSNFKFEIAPPTTQHPSLDKVNIAEAIADSIFSHHQTEKACQFEPNKPCDHCSMCNSRGF